MKEYKTIGIFSIYVSPPSPVWITIQMYDEEEMRFADWDLDDIIYALKTAKKEVKKERKKEKEMSQQITRAQKTDNKE